MPSVRQCWRYYPLRWRVSVELLLADQALTELYAALMRWSVAVWLPLARRVHGLSPIRRSVIRWATTCPRGPYVNGGDTLWREGRDLAIMQVLRLQYWVLGFTMAITCAASPSHTLSVSLSLSFSRSLLQPSVSPCAGTCDL